MHMAGRITDMLLWQDVEKGQGGSGGHKACQSAGGREGYVLGKRETSCSVSMTWEALLVFLDICTSGT